MTQTPKEKTNLERLKASISPWEVKSLAQVLCVDVGEAALLKRLVAGATEEIEIN